MAPYTASALEVGLWDAQEAGLQSRMASDHKWMRSQAGKGRDNAYPFSPSYATLQQEERRGAKELISRKRVVCLYQNSYARDWAYSFQTVKSLSPKSTHQHIAALAEHDSDV